MKYIRLLWFDLKNGYFKCPFAYVSATIIALAGSLEVHRLSMVWETRISVIDYWLYFYGGMKEYVPIAGDAFVFPSVWMLVFLVGAFITLYYPTQDLQKMGMYILVSAQNRKKWWWSKCTWNVMVTLAYHGCIMLIILIVSGIFGYTGDGKLNPTFTASVFGMGTTEFMRNRSITILLLISVLFFAIALNMFQMTLTLFMKPMFGFLTVSVILLASSYFLSPVMIGNYGMAIRYRWLLENGVSEQTGILLSLGILLGSILIGRMKFQTYDILNKE